MNRNLIWGANYITDKVVSRIQRSLAFIVEDTLLTQILESLYPIRTTVLTEFSVDLFNSCHNVRVFSSSWSFSVRRDISSRVTLFSIAQDLCAKWKYWSFSCYLCYYFLLSMYVLVCGCVCTVVDSNSSIPHLLYMREKGLTCSY